MSPEVRERIGQERWDRLVTLSHTCPYAQALLAHIDGGTDAMTAFAGMFAALSEDRERVVKIACDMAASAPAIPIVIPMPPVERP